MASITIRNLDDDLKQRLRLRAASHGHSMEQEARDILRDALNTPEPEEDLATAVARRFAGLGEFPLEPRRNEPPEPAELT